MFYFVVIFAILGCTLYTKADNEEKLNRENGNIVQVNAHLPEKAIDDKEPIFQSAHARYVNDHFFKNKRNGIFVDIGAHNGIRSSNTYFFEKKLEWDGICVEPIPSVFGQLQKNRNCICIQGCITNFNGTATFVEFTGCTLVSGLLDKFDPRHWQRWGFVPHRNIEVQCYTPQTIFDQYNVKVIDFLSLDTEGGEYDILKSIDFSNVFIDIIVVEVRWKDDKRIYNYLTKNGYAFITRIENDDLYKKIDTNVDLL